MNTDINVLALVKEEERYVILFDENGKAEALRVLGRWASNPDLSFGWYDAAILSQKIRGQPIPKKETTVNRIKDVPIVDDSWDIG